MEKVSCNSCGSKYSLGKGHRNEDLCQKCVSQHINSMDSRYVMTSRFPYSEGVAVVLALAFGTIGMLYVRRFLLSSLVVIGIASLTALALYSLNQESLILFIPLAVFAVFHILILPVWAARKAKSLNDDFRDELSPRISSLAGKLEVPSESTVIIATILIVTGVAFPSYAYTSPYMHPIVGYFGLSLSVLGAYFLVSYLWRWKRMMQTLKQQGK